MQNTWPVSLKKVEELIKSVKDWTVEMLNGKCNKNLGSDLKQKIVATDTNGDVAVTTIGTDELTNIVKIFKGEATDTPASNDPYDYGWTFMVTMLENGAIASCWASRFTPNYVLGSAGDGKIQCTSVSTAELGYLNGTKSNIQEQIDAINSSIVGMPDYANKTKITLLGSSSDTFEYSATKSGWLSVSIKWSGDHYGVLVSGIKTTDNYTDVAIVGSCGGQDYFQDTFFIPCEAGRTYRFVNKSLDDTYTDTTLMSATLRGGVREAYFIPFKK